jgi:peptidoglycan/xylan/chitin deacetylase (PgdA/CDA1 family)
VLDWAGFGSAVSYTFDDSHISQISNYAALQALGVPFTFYLTTGFGGMNSPGWEQVLLDGHELGNHTASHPGGASGGIAADTDAATQYIENRFNVVVRSLAAPNGDDQYSNVSRTRFLTNRDVGGPAVAPNDNLDRRFLLPTFLPNENAPTTDFNRQVDNGRNSGTWHTVLVHGFTGGDQNGAYQPVGINQFSAAVRYARDQGDVWIDTVLDVSAYWIGQKTFNAVTPNANGGVTEWSWQLPDHFPPNAFLRVSVDGGTLSQDGVPLVWDGHGYYEVALDAGSLTLAP